MEKLVSIKWHHESGGIAQSVEQGTENPCVPGSIPGPATILYLRQSIRLAFLFLRPEIKQFLSSKSSDDRGAGDESGREHSNYSDFSA